MGMFLPVERNLPFLPAISGLTGKQDPPASTLLLTCSADAMASASDPGDNQGASPLKRAASLR